MIPPCKDENTTFGRYKFFTNCYHLLTFAIPNLDVRVLTGDHYHHSSGSAEGLPYHHGPATEDLYPLGECK